MKISDVHYSENLKIEFNSDWTSDFENRIDIALNNMAESEDDCATQNW